MEKKNLVLVVGKTGSGKTTFIHYLSGIKLKYQEKNEIEVIENGKRVRK